METITDEKEQFLFERRRFVEAETQRISSFLSKASEQFSFLQESSPEDIQFIAQFIAHFVYGIQCMELRGKLEMPRIEFDLNPQVKNDEVAVCAYIPEDDYYVMRLPLIMNMKSEDNHVVFYEFFTHKDEFDVFDFAFFAGIEEGAHRIFVSSSVNEVEFYPVGHPLHMLSDIELD